MNEQITLSQLLEACLAFKNEPTEDHKKEFDALLGKLQIVAYLPMLKKELIAATILNQNFDEELDAVAMGVRLTFSKSIYGILGYALNLDNDLGAIALDLTVVDTLYEMDVFDYILKFCEQDYKRLEKMVDDCLNFANITKIIEIPSLLNEENLNSLKEAAFTFKNDLTVEKLTALKDALKQADPSWIAFKDTVAEAALDKVVQSDLDKAGLTSKTNTDEPKEN